MLRKLLRRISRWWVRRHFSVECESFDYGCACCQAWLSYYYLFDSDSPKLEWDSKLERWYLIYPMDEMSVEGLLRRKMKEEKETLLLLSG